MRRRLVLARRGNIRLHTDSQAGLSFRGIGLVRAPPFRCGWNGGARFHTAKTRDLPSCTQITPKAFMRPAISLRPS